MGLACACTGCRAVAAQADAPQLAFPRRALQPPPHPHLGSARCAPFGLLKWMTVPLSLKRLTSSMAGMLFTPRRFSVFCSRLSSVVVVLWIAFFLRRTEPFPPVRTCAAILASFSGFMAAAGAHSLRSARADASASPHVAAAAAAPGGCAALVGMPEADTRRSSTWRRSRATPRPKTTTRRPSRRRTRRVPVTHPLPLRATYKLQQQHARAVIRK